MKGGNSRLQKPTGSLYFEIRRTTTKKQFLSWFRKTRMFPLRNTCARRNSAGCIDGAAAGEPDKNLS
jgi:hypothetical protein